MGLAVQQHQGAHHHPGQSSNSERDRKRDGHLDRQKPSLTREEEKRCRKWARKVQPRSKELCVCFRWPPQSGIPHISQMGNGGERGGCKLQVIESCQLIISGLLQVYPAPPSPGSIDPLCGRGAKATATHSPFFFFFLWKAQGGRAPPPQRHVEMGIDRRPANPICAPRAANYI